jgi:serine/threonine protein kinase
VWPEAKCTAEASRAAREPAQPDRFGSVRVRGYHCLRRIAVGGSSSVYLAQLPKTGEQRVLKIFRQVPDVVEGGDTFDRFLREYHLVAHLDHPNIARIYDIGVADDHLFLAMEYFPRGDLRQRMGKLLPWQDALGYLRQMAGALGRCTQSASCTGTSSPADAPRGRQRRFMTWSPAPRLEATSPRQA